MIVDAYAPHIESRFAPRLVYLRLEITNQRDAKTSRHPLDGLTLLLTLVAISVVFFSSRNWSPHVEKEPRDVQYPVTPYN